MKLPKELTTITKTSKILAAILFVTLPFLGFFAGMKYQQALNSASQISSTEPILVKRIPTPTTPTPSQTIDTSIWKTYVNYHCGYSVQYPSNLFAVESTRPETPCYIMFNKENKEGAYLIWLSVSNNLKRLSPLDFWTENFQYDDVGSSSKLTEQQRKNEAQKIVNTAKQVNTQSGEIAVFNYSVAGVLAIINNSWFKENKVYTISYSPDDKSYGYSAEQKEKMVTEILSTFKFTP